MNVLTLASTGLTYFHNTSYDVLDSMSRVWYVRFANEGLAMQRFDVLSDGPFRYIHSTETGELFTTLVKERNSNLRGTGKFVEEEGEDEPRAYTLRQWKAILARRWDRKHA